MSCEECSACVVHEPRLCKPSCVPQAASGKDRFCHFANHGQTGLGTSGFSVSTPASRQRAHSALWHLPAICRVFLICFYPLRHQRHNSHGFSNNDEQGGTPVERWPDQQDGFQAVAHGRSSPTHRGGEGCAAGEMNRLSCGADSVRTKRPATAGRYACDPVLESCARHTCSRSVPVPSRQLPTDMMP